MTNEAKHFSDLNDEKFATLLRIAGHLVGKQSRALGGSEGRIALELIEANYLRWDVREGDSFLKRV